MSEYEIENHLATCRNFFPIRLQFIILPQKNKLYIGIYFRGNWEGGWVSCDPEWYVNREWS